MNTLKRLESKRAKDYFTENQLQMLFAIACVDQALAGEVLSAAYEMTSRQLSRYFSNMEIIRPAMNDEKLFTWLVKACLRDLHMSEEALRSIMKLSCAMPEFEILGNLISAGVSEEKAQFFAKEHMEIQNGKLGLADSAVSLYDEFLKQFFDRNPLHADQKKKLEKSKITVAKTVDTLLDSEFVKSMQQRGLHMKKRGWFDKNEPSIYLLNKLDKPCNVTAKTSSYKKVSKKTGQVISTVCVETELAEIDRSTGYQDFFTELHNAGKNEVYATEYDMSDESSVEIFKKAAHVLLEDYACVSARASEPERIPACLTFSRSDRTAIAFDQNSNSIRVLTDTHPSCRYRTEYHSVFAFKRGELLYSHKRLEDDRMRKIASRPLTLADAAQIAKCCPLSIEYMQELLLYDAAVNPFMKDVLKLYNSYTVGASKGVTVTFPLKFSDAFKCKNWSEYFKRHYKAAKDMNVNFNKLDPRISYIAVTAAPYIVQSDIQRLILWLKEESHENIDACIHRMHYCRSKKARACEVLKMMYAHTFAMTVAHTASPFDDGHDDDGQFNLAKIQDYDTLCDWINMSVQMNIPLSLKKSSMRKIKEEHNRINDIITRKKIDSIKGDKRITRKRSSFNALEKKLPEEFERISTQKRLLAEGLIQHHCVATYEQAIKDDQCAIFSTISPQTGERHTIEIIKEGKGFYVKQIQKKYNSGRDNDVVETLVNILGTQAMRRFVKCNPDKDSNGFEVLPDTWDPDPWGFDAYFPDNFCGDDNQKIQNDAEPALDDGKDDEYYYSCTSLPF